LVVPDPRSPVDGLMDLFFEKKIHLIRLSTSHCLMGFRTPATYERELLMEGRMECNCCRIFRWGTITYYIVTVHGWFMLVLVEKRKYQDYVMPYYTLRKVVRILGGDEMMSLGNKDLCITTKVHYVMLCAEDCL
jgi:hypothetical protein